MKKSIIAVGLLVALLVTSIALFWPRAAKGTTGIRLSGAVGTPIGGYYVRDGQRIPISGVLPLSLDSIGITEFEIRKIHPEQTFAFAARYDEVGGAHAVQSREIAPGVVGVRGRVRHHGLSTESITR